LILAIESSCDDSSVCVMELNTLKILYKAKESQEAQHSIYGGVVPELASRLHAVSLPKIIENAKEFFPYLKAVAVTNEPGLTLSLAQGVIAAKALAIGLKIPLIPVHHIVGHIFSVFIEKKCFYPLSALVASGGHTSILTMNSYEKITEEASTMDDSIGESFDKAAKMLDLGYPGGTHIEKLAKKGDENAYKITIPLRGKKTPNFSYSGLKNAIRLLSKDKILSQKEKEDIAASFQRAAVIHLLDRCEMFFKKNCPKNFALVGGVSANLYLREKLQELCDNYAVNFLVPPLKYTSDNAVMIARVAVEAFGLGHFMHNLEIEINSRKPFGRNHE